VSNECDRKTPQWKAVTRNRVEAPQANINNPVKYKYYAGETKGRFKFQNINLLGQSFSVFGSECVKLLLLLLQLILLLLLLLFPV
jgi:hypothetical protein